MNDKRKLFNNIVDVINLARYSFYDEFGREPNKVIMNVDVIEFILSYDKDMITHNDNSRVTQIMGLDVEIIYDKKGFIEVGYFTYNPLIVNVDYAGGAE